VTLATPDSVAGGREIVEFLARFGVAMGRRRAYAGEHPIVSRSEAELLAALKGLLASKGPLSVGVARKELLVNGEAPEGRSAALRDLAERLHRRGVGSLTFSAEVDQAGLQAALEWLSAPPPADGSSNSAGRPDTPGITIRGIAYDHFSLVEGGEVDRERVDELWRQLAVIAADLDQEEGTGGGGNGGGEDGPSSGERRRGLGAQASRGIVSGGTEGTVEEGQGSGEVAPAETLPDLDELVSTSPQEVADAIERRIQNPAYSRRVAFVLVSLVDQVAHSPAAQREAMGERLRAVLERLADSSISRIIQSVGAAAERRRFLSQVIDILPISAVIEWLEVAAGANEQELSHHLLRLLAKLSSLAEGDAPHPLSEETFRGAARDLVVEWELHDPNPAEHLALLDHIALFEASDDGSGTRGGGLGEMGAIRLVQMALEMGEAGDDALHAADELVKEGRLVQLYGWIDAVPPSAATARLQERLTSARSVREVLLGDAPDLPAAQMLLPTLELHSLPVLLEVLELSGDRRIRRMVFDHLVQMGPAIGPLVLARMEDASWYVLRNLLALLREVHPGAGAGGGWKLPHGKLSELMSHAHVKVRQEALRLLVADPVARSAAIWTALEDGDDAMAHVALEAIANGTAPLSQELAVRILLFIERPRTDPELTARAIQALGVRRFPMVRDWLVSHVVRRTALLRRRVLQEDSPSVRAALEVLGRLYPGDPAAAPVLDLALRRGGGLAEVVRGRAPAGAEVAG